MCFHAIALVTAMGTGEFAGAHGVARPEHFPERRAKHGVTFRADIGNALIDVARHGPYQRCFQRKFNGKRVPHAGAQPVNDGGDLHQLQ